MKNKIKRKQLNYNNYLQSSQSLMSILKTIILYENWKVTQ